MMRARSVRRFAGRTTRLPPSTTKVFCSFSEEAASWLATRNLPALIDNVGDLTGNGRPINVDIEDVQEDADPGFARIQLTNGHYLAIRGSYHQVFACGNGTFRITKEIQAKDGQNIERYT